MALKINFAGKALLLVLVSMLSFANASEFDANTRNPDSSSPSKNGGFLEFGISTTVDRRIERRVNPDDDGDTTLGLGLTISAGYRHEGLFFEASESGLDGLNLGVTLFETDRWSVDFLLANIDGRITVESDEPPPPTTESERNSAILERDNIFIAAGTRVTGFFGDNIVQLRLVTDWHGGNGVLGSARVGRHWQVGNWNMRAILGARFNSREFNNYVFGVSSEEQTERFSQYSAGSAVIPELELGASLPLRRDWVYSARFRYRQYPSSVTNSPLVAENSDIILTTGIHYVF